MCGLILYEVESSVVNITMNRPEKKNAMGFAMLYEFTQSLRLAGSDEDVRVVVHRGTSVAICPGADLADLSSVPGEEWGLRASVDDGGRWWPIFECPKSMIGAIDGPAVGMGTEFATQRGSQIASGWAHFARNFLRSGPLPDKVGVSRLLPSLVHSSQASRLLYSGEFLSAREAHGLKFVSSVFEPQELNERAEELAWVIPQGSPSPQKQIRPPLRGYG